MAQCAEILITAETRSKFTDSYKKCTPAKITIDQRVRHAYHNHPEDYMLNPRESFMCRIAVCVGGNYRVQCTSRHHTVWRIFFFFFFHCPCVWPRVRRSIMNDGNPGLFNKRKTHWYFSFFLQFRDWVTQLFVLFIQKLDLKFYSDSFLKLFLRKLHIIMF